MMSITRRAIFPVVLAALAVILGASCLPKWSTGEPPDWIDPSAPGFDETWFYGRGCAQPDIGNLFFKDMTAEERARVDLANNLHRYLLSETGGDAEASRTIVEAALPLYERDGAHLKEGGELCVRVKLSKDEVEKRLPF